MAKKPRTPPPPRRVQAPQRREPKRGERRAAARRDWLATRYVFSAAGVALIAIAAVLFFVLRNDDSGGGGTTADTTRSLGQILATVGCKLQTFKAGGRTHLAAGAPEPKYNSFPPTSGPHDPTPALWNYYTTPVPEIQAVHNLEHGGIVINWGSKVAQAQVDQIHSLWEDSPNAMLVFPLPQLGNKIALTAWTHLAACTRFGDTAFRAFRDKYRGKGPERFPVAALTPGT